MIHLAALHDRLAMVKEVIIDNMLAKLHPGIGNFYSRPKLVLNMMYNRGPLFVENYGPSFIALALLH